MKSVADIVNRLSVLSDDDRAWILRRLSKSAQHRLLAMAEGNKSQPPRVDDSRNAKRDGDRTAVMDPLACFDVAVIAEVLREEPQWVALLLVRIEDWGGRNELLSRLPQAVRQLSESPVASGIHPAPQLIRAVVQLLVPRLEERVPPQLPSRFESLVSRFAAARSRKRRSLHL